MRLKIDHWYLRDGVEQGRLAGATPCAGRKALDEDTLDHPETFARRAILDNRPRLGRDSVLMRLSARPAFRNLGRGVF
jgi:hypothetical protein